jgi:hypothetical protein
VKTQKPFDKWFSNFGHYFLIDCSYSGVVPFSQRPFYGGTDASPFRSHHRKVKENIIN